MACAAVLLRAPVGGSGGMLRSAVQPKSTHIRPTPAAPPCRHRRRLVPPSSTNPSAAAAAPLEPDSSTPYSTAADDLPGQAPAESASHSASSSAGGGGGGVMGWLARLKALQQRSAARLASLGMAAVLAYGGSLIWVGRGGGNLAAYSDAIACCRFC